MKNLACILLFVCGVAIGKNLNATSPRTRIDSLSQLVELSTDTVLSQVYGQLAWNYRNIDADSSFLYAKQYHELSTKLKINRGIAESLNYMGIALRNKGDYSDAMSAFYDALKVAENAQDPLQLHYTMINIGNIYLYQENYKGALQYFERSLQNAKKHEDLRMKAYSYLNIGRAYIGLNDLTIAKANVDKAIEIRASMGDNEGIAIANVELAEIMMANGDNNEALALLSTNINDLIKLGDNNTLAYSHVSIAKICLSEKQYDRALEHIREGLAISHDNKLRNIEVQGLKIMAEIYEKLNDPVKALQTYKAYLKKKDSVFNEESTERIAMAFSEYTLEKSEEEKTNLLAKKALDEAIIKRQRITIALSIVSTALFFIIAVLSIRSASIRKKLNMQIQEQKEEAFRQNNELIDINNEKNNLIRILSHDLRAPINNIKGLTQVHQLDHAEDFTDSENETLNMIKSESDRLLNMITKILHVEALNDDKQDIKIEKVDVRGIVTELTKSFKNAAETKGIEILSKITDEPTYIHGDEIHIRQIMENLLSNAIKFTKQDSKITTELRTKNNKVVIAISDQGPGLTSEDEEKIFKKFQTLSAKPTGNEDSTGLGLSIVKRYTEEMKGNVWYESQLGKGTTFFVEFDKVEASIVNKVS